MKRRNVLIGLGLLSGGSFIGYRFLAPGTIPDIELYLRDNEFLLAEISEVFIPETDTPGAKEAGVAPALIRIITDCLDRKWQNKLVNGLEEIKEYTWKQKNKDFINCDPKEKIEVIRHFENSGIRFSGILGRVQSKLFGLSFFQLLKQYIVHVYCTSFLGATKGLDFVYVPGKLNGCIDLDVNQKVWATE